MIPTFVRDTDESHRSVDAVSVPREPPCAGDRGRHLVRRRDTTPREGCLATPAGVVSPDAAPWTCHERVADNIYKDLEIDPETGVVTTAATFTHGYALAALTSGSGLPPDDTRFFHADMLGTTRFLSDGSGDVVNRQGYSAFGELLGVGPEADFPRYGYVGSWGYQNDGLADGGQDIGLLHVGARHYEPAPGRFFQRDPIGVFGGLNIYAYACGEPTGLVDPGGETYAISLVSAQGLMAQWMVRVMTGAVLSLHAANRMAARGLTYVDVIDAILYFGALYWDTAYGNIVYVGDAAAVSYNSNNVIPHVRPSSWFNTCSPRYIRIR